MVKKNQEKKESKPRVIKTEINLKEPPAYVPGLKLNIGSGVDYKEGFLNIDKYDSSADANWDAKELPLNDNSVAQIFAHQLLEHLGTHEILPTLKEWHRVLKAKGNVIVIVPDLVSICEKVLKNPEDEWNLAKLFGNQEHEGQFHKTGFTPKRLFKLFGFAGFRQVNSAYLGDAEKHIYIEAIK